MVLVNEKSMVSARLGEDESNATKATITEQHFNGTLMFRERLPDFVLIIPTPTCLPF
jgi:hypothetical protein